MTATLRANVAAPWSAAQMMRRLSTASTPDAINRDAWMGIPWGVTNPQASRNVSAWGVTRATDHAVDANWGRFSSLLTRSSESIWGISSQADRVGVITWGEFQHRIEAAIQSRWAISAQADRLAVLPWGRYATLHGAFLLPMPVSRVADGGWHMPWLRYSITRNPSWGLPTEDGGTPVDENGTVIVPVKGVYIVLNEVTLQRVSDSTALDCLALQISMDADSWVCGFSATLPGAALDAVIGSAGSPVELEASINGIAFRLLAEKVSRDRSFGKSRIAISGRGRAAVLDTPYAALMSFTSSPAINAQQAAEAAITAVGLESGWSLDWQLTDWLLPAGLWSHQGSAISAVTRIAQAAGGYVQADPLTQVLHVLPRYPAYPWDWPTTTSDIEIPAAVAVTEGIAWEDKPVYNAVYISGATGGILGHVKRTGTAGDLVAQMVTDDLTTHVDAARQRGGSILSDTGRQARISISLPVLDETGIIMPGQIVRYVDGATVRLGLSRSVSINAALPKVRQTVEIETHA